MLKIVLVVWISSALSLGQQYPGSPQTAAILSEQRYLAGDGKFGSSYSQEDGINFKEESDSDGTRHGSYSYIDPNGQRKTISYTAGKNGFQASGDHIPAPPVTLPPPINNTPVPRSTDNGQDDGSYDQRYNDPNFSLNNHHNKPHNQYQALQTEIPLEKPTPRIQYNQNQPIYRQPISTYQASTTITPRIYPPGKLSLNRTPDGFSYSFNKI